MPSDNPPPDVSDPSAWIKAKRLASLLGPVPSSVGNVVKSLWRDHLVCMDTGTVEVSSTSNSAVRLVDKSSVLKLPLYFAAESLHPERFAEVREDDGSRALIRILHPGLFAALLSLLYMHRRFKKICPSEQWSELSKEYILNMELGYLIGRGCPKIGEAFGVLMGGIRYASLAIFLKHDPAGYDGYRNRKMTFNIPFEHERWSCDHGQIAGSLLRALGFGVDQMHSGNAIRATTNTEFGAVSPDFSSWTTVIRLMEALKNKEKLSEVNLTDIGFTLSDEEISSIVDSTNTLFEKGSSFTWMLKSYKSDDDRADDDRDGESS